MGRLIKVAAGIVEVLVDGAESAWRTNELIEQHLIPTLARVAEALEAAGSSGARSNNFEGAPLR